MKKRTARSSKRGRKCEATTRPSSNKMLKAVTGMTFLQLSDDPSEAITV